MPAYDFVILGGGMVAGYAAQEMADGNLERGALAIISADTVAPYERPPLSKGFLAGDEDESDVLINPGDFYEAHGIDVMLRTRVDRLDTRAKRLHLASGDAVDYGQLVIATGARVRTFAEFGTPGADLAGIHYLRSLDDSKRIRDALAGTGRAAVIGAGFIGMEVAAVLAEKGLDVTMVFPEERVWERVFTPEMSGFFERYYQDRGVTIRPGAKVTGFEGDGRVSAVQIEGGDRIETDIVVAGIGVAPVTDIAEGTQVEVDNGIVVDEYLFTGEEGVYAAGDVANYKDILFDKRRRVEHWDNAVEQGKHIGRQLLGDTQAFVHVPYFFSDEFDLSYELWGDTEIADRYEIRGDLDSGAFSTWWLKDGGVVGAFVMNRPDEERDAAVDLIRERKPLPGSFGERQG